ncbi:GTP cyclohydrolase II [Propionibacteriaceae bacterium Y1923]|uniref:GTP cyclohydrolase II n=1 Tax=Aestuariimicrobium sp. Y1814 TaxID=3418742 RepID=UPI003C1A8E2B
MTAPLELSIVTDPDRVEHCATTRMPTEHGTFTAHVYRDLLTGAEHVALVSPGGLEGTRLSTPLVRMHSECLTGDVFGSLRCDCGPQLQRSMQEVAERGGAVIYLRGHEGRGVGLAAKLQAYALQDQGVDTVDAQLELGLPVDAREYGAAVAMLADLGIDRIALLTNNPAKVEALRAAGIVIDQVESVEIPPNPDNEFYLQTKRDRMRHRILLDQMEA